MLNVEVLMAALDRGEKTQAYMQEQLWAMKYFRRVARGGETPLSALAPQAAGRLSLSLLDGLRVLREGGLVIMNPEGDVRWDGRPSPVRRGAAWLGLHSGAPVVPALCTTGNYDLWPRWQAWPARRGSFEVRVGSPFRLTEEPKRRASPEAVDSAAERIRHEFDSVRYGAGGIGEWLGPILKEGNPLPEGMDLRAAAAQVTAGQHDDNRSIPLRKRGVALLLWRCPVCQTDDALFVGKMRRGVKPVRCGTCGTQWELRRVLGKDFRMRVTAGPVGIVGLDMPLCAWYDEAIADLDPVAMKVEGLALQDGEEVYLEAPSARLRASQPNPLSDSWAHEEAPAARPAGQPPLADWPVIGAGRLLLTNQRLAWLGGPGQVNFKWGPTTSISLWLFNTLGVVYGTAPYRFELGGEVGLKWLAYAAVCAKRVPRALKYELTISPY